MSDIIFHIGLHKTGTTFLQNEYFPKLPLTYLSGSEPFYKILEIIKANDKKILLSEENFSGQLFSGRKDQQFFDTISSIKSAFPEAKIIIGFRNHIEFIVSSYKQMLHEGGIFSFNDFYNLNDTGVLKDKDLNYRGMLEILNSNFNDVFVYTMDDIKNINSFNLEISRFLGIINDEIIINKRILNKSVQSSFQVTTLLNLNRFDNKFKRLFGFKLLYSKFFKVFRITPRFLCQQYLPSNGRLFSIDKNLYDEIESKFEKDWEFILSSKSI